MDSSSIDSSRFHFFVAITVVPLFFLAVVLLFTPKLPSLSTSESSSLVCDLDAKLCPDGSAVGRTDPNCEFADCPGYAPILESTTSWKTFDSHLDKVGTFTTENWTEYNFSTGGVQFTFNYPPSWVEGDGFSGFQIKNEEANDPDETFRKIMEFLPGIVNLKPGQKCFDSYDTTLPINKLISKENITLNNLTGVKIVQEVVTGPRGLIWFPNIYCLQQDNTAVVISFYETKLNSADRLLFDQILSTFRFLDNHPVNSESNESYSQICASNGGKWLKDHQECEGLNQQQCTQLFSGNFDECASACRHDPESQVCTMQCVPVCKVTASN